MSDGSLSVISQLTSQPIFATKYLFAKIINIDELSVLLHHVKLNIFKATISAENQ